MDSKRKKGGSCTFPVVTRCKKADAFLFRAQGSAGNPHLTWEPSIPLLPEQDLKAKEPVEIHSLFNILPSQHAHLLPSEHRKITEAQQPATQDADSKRKYHLNSALICDNVNPGRVPAPSLAGECNGAQIVRL